MLHVFLPRRFFFTAISDVHIQLGGYVLHCRILGTSQETEKWLK